MFLLARHRFRFDMPVQLQQKHLLDIHHLTVVHRLTLAGVSVQSSVRRHNRVHFQLRRFGIPTRGTIHQHPDHTVVQLPHFTLRFQIHPDSESSHWLEVQLFCIWPLYFLTPLFWLLFWLTAWEDRCFYEQRFRKKSAAKSQ